MSEEDYDEEIEEDDDLEDWDLSGEGTPAMKKHADLLSALTDFDSFIKDIFNNWLGLYWDSENEVYKQHEDFDPIMNKRGALWCASFLKAYVRKNNIITNIGKEDYINLVKGFILSFCPALGIRKKEFGIKSNSDLIRVYEEMEASIKLMLLGAGDGKYNSLLTSTVNRSETVNLTPKNNDERGFLSKLKNKLI